MALGLVLLIAACSLTKQEARDVRETALTVTQIACIFASSLIDAAIVAKTCSIEEHLAPLVHNLIGQREGARRAGVIWPDHDAGAGAP